MRVTLLGTGSPIPTLERAGTSLVVEIADETILVDCGPGTTHRLIEHEIHPAEIETLVFTHHHVDHDADFFQFVVASWSLGREALTIYGPEGTDRLLDALHDLYEEDLEYRSELGYPFEGISGIETRRVTPDATVEGDGWRMTALPVEHSIETYAYRFEETETGSTFVFSADTRKSPELAAFASDADLLVQDACIGPPDDEPTAEGLLWERLTEPLPEWRREALLETHCDASQAGEIAADANANTLVLTHLLPYRDTEAMRRDAERTFDGEVIVGEDGLTVSI